MKTLLTVAALLALSSSSTFALGAISMSSTAYPDSIVVEVTVNDDGSLPNCGWLAITRGGVDVYYFERDLFDSQSVTFTDTDVEPSTGYCYAMALRWFPAPVPCPDGTLCDAFDCFCQIETCAVTGPGPMLIGRGFLSSEFPDGSPVDNNEVRALLYECGSTTEFVALHILPPGAEQYVDSQTAVRVSGDFWCCWAQCVWLLEAQQVVPQSCAVRTESTTWGQVKSIYR